MASARTFTVAVLTAACSADPSDRAEPTPAEVLAPLVADEQVIPDSAGTKAVRRMLRLLDDFKDSPGFHRWGFAEDRPYVAWYEEVERLSRDQRFTLEERVALGDVMLLGIEYVGSHGRETKSSDWLRRSIRRFLDDR